MHLLHVDSLSHFANVTRQCSFFSTKSAYSSDAYVILLLSVFLVWWAILNSYWKLPQGIGWRVEPFLNTEFSWCLAWEKFDDRIMVQSKVDFKLPNHTEINPNEITFSSKSIAKAWRFTVCIDVKILCRCIC